MRKGVGRVGLKPSQSQISGYVTAVVLSCIRSTGTPAVLAVTMAVRCAFASFRMSRKIPTCCRRVACVFEVKMD